LIMDINRNNYEACLLDLIEGRLNPEEARKVRDFLLLNPDCIEGIAELQPWTLESEVIPFPGKERLKKIFPETSSVLSESNFDLFSIARMEDDLTGEQEADHARMVARDEEKNREWLQWQKTKLVGENIPFKGKNRLKRVHYRRTRVIWLGLASAAAAIALLIILVRTGPDQVNPDRPKEISGVELATEPDARTTGTDEVAVVPGEGMNSAMSAEEPVTLTFRKHEEPAALTERDEKLTILKGSSDPLQQEAILQHLQPHPLRIAAAEINFPLLALPGTTDRIDPIPIATEIQASKNLTLAQYYKLGLKRAYKEFTRDREISLLTIASAGINGINRLTGSDLSLDVSRDKSGSVSGFRFKSNLFSVMAPIENAE
jgi:hypothetical protein